MPTCEFLGGPLDGDFFTATPEEARPLAPRVCEPRPGGEVVAAYLLIEDARGEGQHVYCFEGWTDPEGDPLATRTGRGGG